MGLIAEHVVVHTHVSPNINTSGTHCCDPLPQGIPQGIPSMSPSCAPNGTPTLETHLLHVSQDQFSWG